MGSPENVFGDALKKGASDVHMAVGSPLQYRIDGQLESQGKTALKKSDVEQFIKTVLGQKGVSAFKEALEIDSSYSLKNGTRLRVNCHFERGNPGLVARLIPSEIPSLEDLGLQDIYSSLCTARDGLILFTGPTGAGKSTSLAAIISQLLQDRAAHVVTLEDPIEFLFEDGQGIARQRQLGEDFHSFAEALRRVLRQDPDVLMVGEMRDLETIAAALTLAETGHLVFATLHTPNAVQTVDRIVDVFPPHQQTQIRTQLSLSLRGIVAQRLLPGKDGGRVAQREVLVNTPAVANIIRESRTQELTSAMQTGVKDGMCTFERDAKALLKESLITKEVAELAGKLV